MSRNRTPQSKSPQKTRQEEERAQRREAILDAALILFSRQGYAETTLTEVADRARLGKATLYYYFPDKETIFWEIYKSETIRYYQSMEEEVRSIGDPLEILRAYLYRYIDYGYRNTDFLRLFFPLGKSAPVGTPKHREILEELDAVRQPMDQHLATVLEASDSSYTGEALTELTWSVLSGLSLKIIQGKPKEDVEREVESFLSLLMPQIRGAKP